MDLCSSQKIAYRSDRAVAYGTKEKENDMRCTDCSTEDPTKHYRSGKMARCYDCQNYHNLKTKIKPEVLSFSREDFLAWKHNEERRCFYCLIEERDIYDLQVVNVRTKKVMESIGVDRADNSQGYVFSNMVLCCGPCNAVKGSILTQDEMLALRAGLQQIWRQRLTARLKVSLLECSADPQSL